MKNISDVEFRAELAARGFRLVEPGDPSFTTWGYIDIGGGFLVNRWMGGSTNAEHLAYCIKRREEMGAVAAAKPPVRALGVVAKRAAKKVAKKAVKKVAKKGAVR